MIGGDNSRVYENFFIVSNKYTLLKKAKMLRITGG